MTRLLVVGLLACATASTRPANDWNAPYLQAYSCGAIGCPPKEIQISQHEITGDSIETWIASCRGKQFVCGSNYHGIHCKEMISTP